MNMLQTPTSSRDAAGAQKKKGIKSSLGRFFSKKDKVSSSVTHVNYFNNNNNIDDEIDDNVRFVFTGNIGQGR
jgi:hypothetical protein